MLVIFGLQNIEPDEPFHPEPLERTFVIRTNDVFIGELGGGLLETLCKMALSSSLMFIVESDTRKDNALSAH